ncbi:MAG: antibiotic biosynthesis monooxygenase, partial [Pseudomonadota bacterium]
SGLEVWFEAPQGTIAAQPVRWRMACLIFLTVFALVEALSFLLSIVAPGLGPPFSTAVVILVQVLLLTYVLLPLLTRVFAFWIFPDAKP